MKTLFQKKREALVQYDLGIDESKKENYEEAIKYYKKAIKIDPNFAFAYDNIGISYRKLGNYKEAINYYEKSLKIDPNGITPLQNIAVAYQYTKEYDKSIKTYKKLAEIDPQNPEVFYGIGHVYTSYLKEYEKGLDYLCKAYNIYVEQNSPYRSDAETLIQMIYSEMNKAGNKDKFLEILEKNNIKTN
ncbi:tetratricopeptide repeat protein [Flavobacterium ponti]|uniref:Tetratricopeptide repeat protein n=1 Tax=Flavobacterium ponti TaxID=665133 RepID=A0ABV9P5H0_9FLAO